MKRPFQVGDRVAVYDRGPGVRGVIEKLSTSEALRGLFGVHLDAENSLRWYHPKQLRRLVPRKRREWDMAIPDNKLYRPIIGDVGSFEVGGGVGDRGPEWRIAEIVRVVEAPRKKGEE